MTKSSDSAARTDGSAFFVIAHHRGPAWRDGVGMLEQPGIEAHVGFMRSLDRRGVMVLGGPFMDADDAADPIVGMAIVRAVDLAEAEALAAEDPSIELGLIRARVRAWNAAMGTSLD
jgi:uncharacterized protein